MKYVIMVMMMTGVCVGQTVVDLPSSFQLFRSNEKLACVATATTICYGPTAEEIAKRATVPRVDDFMSPYRRIADVKLDPEGSFVYIVVVSEYGYYTRLYRFDVVGERWTPLAIPDESASITALFVDREGSVLVGTEGGASGAFNPNHVGMFRSADNGDNWAEVNTRESSDEWYPKVSQIESTSDGRLVAHFEYHDSSGIFIRQNDGHWIKVRGFISSGFVVAGNMIYCKVWIESRGPFAVCIDLDQVPWIEKPLDSITSRFRNPVIRPWTGDTVAVFFEGFYDKQLPEVQLIHSGSIVDTVSLVEMPGRIGFLTFETDRTSLKGSRFIVLGGGHNSIVDSKGKVVGNIAPGMHLAGVGTIRQTSTWTRAYVSGHGWYSIEFDGSAVLDSSAGPYDLFLGRQSYYFSEYATGILIAEGYDIIDMQKFRVDTLKEIGGRIADLRFVVRRHDMSIVASTAHRGLLELQPSDSLWRPFSSVGLPDVLTGDPARYIPGRIKYLFEVDEKLYLWVDRARDDWDTYAGLYTYGSQWSRVECPGMAIKSSLISVGSDEEGVVLSVYESDDNRSGSSQPTFGVVHIRNGKRQPRFYRSTIGEDKFVWHAICRGPEVTWITVNGDVITSRDPNTEPILVRSGLNSTVGRVGNRLLVATRDSGLFIYDATSSVNESDNNARVRVQAYPQPASSHVTFSTHNNEQILRTDIYNVAGELVLSLSHEPSNDITISTDGLSSGVYLARVTTTSAITTIPIIILAH
ncbi:MAG TPA: T9SS type A sorting domain-containing protein [Candidatus Didemnitutus sp.]|nr:T9SS type A sorting domain-containing protein [Candidatus Didemnitutus sp.]